MVSPDLVVGEFDGERLALPGLGDPLPPFALDHHEHPLEQHNERSELAAQGLPDTESNPNPRPKRTAETAPTPHQTRRDLTLKPHLGFPPLAGHVFYAAWFSRCRVWWFSHSVGVR